MAGDAFTSHNTFAVAMKVRVDVSVCPQRVAGPVVPGVPIAARRVAAQPPALGPAIAPRAAVLAAREAAESAAAAARPVTLFVALAVLADLVIIPIVPTPAN